MDYGEIKLKYGTPGNILKLDDNNIVVITEIVEADLSNLIQESTINKVINYGQIDNIYLLWKEDFQVDNDNLLLLS